METLKEVVAPHEAAGMIVAARQLETIGKQRGRLEGI